SRDSACTASFSASASVMPAPQPSAGQAAPAPAAPAPQAPAAPAAQPAAPTSDLTKPEDAR
ncbi:hypothetical protein ABT082_39645, partial [Streptomyces massasporeus]